MNRLILSLLFIFVFIKSQAQGGIESGLVAKYCFSGNANDALGLRNATVFGATLTTDRLGRPNEAYDFNGLADYIQMPSDVWVSGNFSFTGWIYLRTYGHWSRFFEWGNGIDQDNVFFSPCQSSSAYSVFTIHQCSSSARTYATSPTATFPTGAWVHIAVTLSGNIASVYKNNVLWYTYTMGFIPCSVVRTQCYFGKSNFPADKSLDGKIDDVRFYNRVITVAEIDTIYKLTGCSYVTPCDSTKRFAKANNDTSICVSKSGDASVYLNASGGTNYSWSPAALFSNPNLASVNTNISSSTQFIVKVIDAMGCIDYDTVNITLKPLPIVIANLDTVHKCVGKQEQLKASGALYYQWSPPTGLSSSVLASPMLTVQPSITKYIVTGTDAKGCSNTDSVIVDILPGPTVSAFPSDTFGCIGKEIQLHASGAKTYKWFPYTGIINDTSAHPKLIISGNFSYVVEGKDINGCLAYDTINVQSYPIPDIKASITSIKGKCDSAIVQLNAIGALSYTWSPSIYCDNNKVYNPIVKIPHELVFTVEGENAYGCVGFDTVRVAFTGESVVNVPNAFTPNDDQINDRIRPLVACDFVLKEFSIFNRWGQMVYTTQNINSSWDGTFNGKPCNMDVYYYMIKGVNSAQKEMLYKGDITLIR